MPRTWVVVLHYSGLEDTRACIRSLLAQRDVECQVLVIDNASQEPAATFLAEFPSIDLIRTERNLGWAGGNNVGIRRAMEHGADRVLLVNNDAIADPRLVARLGQAGDANAQFGILGPIVRDLEPPHEVQTDGFIFNDPTAPGFFSRPPVAIARRDHALPTVVDRDVIVGCCLWVRSDVFRRIGLIDERFFLIHEETDFCLRAAAVGVKCGIVPEDLFLHRRSTSFTEARRQTGKAWLHYFDVRNLALLMRRHAGRFSGKRRRGRSWREFILHAYYYYTDALERGDPPAARAITEGLADAFSGRWGPYAERPRPLAAAFAGLFNAARRVRPLFGGSSQVAVLAPMEPPGA